MWQLMEDLGKEIKGKGNKFYDALPDSAAWGCHVVQVPTTTDWWSELQSMSSDFGEASLFSLSCIQDNVTLDRANIMTLCTYGHDL